MKKYVAMLLILLLSIMCMGMITYADSDQKVNVDGLKIIEEKDDFAVRITEKELELDTGLSINGNDLILLTINNYSNDLIRDITVYVIMYNDNLEQESASISFSKHHSPDVYESESIDIGLDGWKTLSIACNADRITGVRAIVASYTSMDGILVENSNASTWQENAFAG